MIKLPGAFLVCAACAATLGAGQVILPTAKAQPSPAPDYCVRLEGVRVRRGAGGLEITGRVVNTGRRALTYTSVAAVLTGGDGVEVGRGTGYLAAGPVGPGQAAELRASAPPAPAFTGVTWVLREAGRPVRVETAPD